MISSADESMLILRKWLEEATLLLVFIGVDGAGGAFLRGLTISTLDETRVEFTGSGDSPRVMLVLQNAIYEFVHPHDLPHLTHLRGKLKLFDSVLSIKSPKGLTCALFPLTDAIEKYEAQNKAD